MKPNQLELVEIIGVLQSWSMMKLLLRRPCGTIIVDPYGLRKLVGMPV